MKEALSKKTKTKTDFLKFSFFFPGGKYKTSKEKILKYRENLFNIPGETRNDISLCNKKI